MERCICANKELVASCVHPYCTEHGWDEERDAEIERLRADVVRLRAEVERLRNALPSTEEIDYLRRSLPSYGSERNIAVLDRMEVAR